MRVEVRTYTSALTHCVGSTVLYNLSNRALELSGVKGSFRMEFDPYSEFQGDGNYSPPSINVTPISVNPL